jgi:hypothetical protein
VKARHHYTRNTVSAALYCKKCGQETQHRIDGGRKGPCLPCMARLEANAANREPETEERQEVLFA